MAGDLNKTCNLLINSKNAKWRRPYDNNFCLGTKLDYEITLHYGTQILHSLLYKERQKYQEIEKNWRNYHIVYVP